MGILWVRGSVDEKRQRHAEQPGLVFKEAQGGEEVSVQGKAGRWIYKKEELGGRLVGRTGQMDGRE